MIRKIFSGAISPLWAILTSVPCYFMSTGFHHSFSFLLFVAPVPLLICCAYKSARTVFLTAMAVSVLSHLNIFEYLTTFVPIPAACVYVCAISVIFALIIVLTKIISERLNTAVSLFAFPVLYTAFEFAAGSFIPDGTFGSIAYTQIGAPVITHIASVTGMYGITFFLCLVASATASILTRSRETRFRMIIPALIMIMFVPGYGAADTFNRSDSGKNQFKTACFRVDGLRSGGNPVNPANMEEVISTYLGLIRDVRGKADCVLLPEKIIALSPTDKHAIYSRFSSAAAANNSLIVAGFRIRGAHDANVAAIFFPDGSTVREYVKRYTVPGWENGYLRGDRPLSFSYRGKHIGVAVCKDMDFPSWIRAYAGNDLMLVPAWDFRKDHRMHADMAVMRGIENGFTVARAAREGDLTVSDASGRRTGEIPYNVDQTNASLITVSFPSARGTVYSSAGSWFGISVVIVLVFMSGFAIFICNDRQATEKR